MTTYTRAPRAGVIAYYLGRPAAFWLTALAPSRQRPADNSTARLAHEKEPAAHPR